MRRDYIDGPFGQIHIRQWGDNDSLPPIVCLSPSPFSSLAYMTIAPLLAEHRKVIALDYPGYGNSDATPAEATITDYAEVTAQVIKTIANGQEADLLGFHTGCLVAVETALNHPEMVKQLVLMDVPYFDESKQAELLVTMGAPNTLKPDISMLNSTWEFCIGKRLEHIPLARAYQMFVDHISSGEQCNAAFRAAFQYPCTSRFKQLSHNTTVIATKAGLYEQSLLCAKTIAGATLIEVPEVAVAVLEQGAPIVADKIFQALS